MREKTIAMLNKIHTYLIEHEYVTNYDLQKFTHLGASSIYRCIRLLRLQGIGIHPTKKGYILSEFAKKQDDVHFVRRCYGRRTSDIIAIKAAEKFIRSRWKSVDDKNNIRPVLQHLTIDIPKPIQAEGGMKYLLSYVNGKGN